MNNNPQQLYQFVKASERLPEKSGTYFCRDLTRYEHKHFTSIFNLHVSGNGAKPAHNKSILLTKSENIEWLEEIPTPVNDSDIEAEAESILKRYISFYNSGANDVMKFNLNTKEVKLFVQAMCEFANYACQIERKSKCIAHGRCTAKVGECEYPNCMSSQLLEAEAFYNSLKETKTVVKAEDWLSILKKHNPVDKGGIPGWVLNAFSEYAQQFQPQQQVDLNKA